MRRNLLLLLTALLPLAASAYDAEINGIYYNFSGNEATVTCIYYDSYYNQTAYTGAVVIPSNVIYSGKTYSVTSIGNYAFRGCSGLTSITIPNSVTSIGGAAFSGCSGLTSITIPNSVTSIGDGAFYECKSLTSITIGNSVTSIGFNAFYYCSGLTSVTIPNSVTSIGGAAFSGCSGLTSITIPNSVTSIGSSAFGGCSGLTSVTIPNSVTSIGSSAFEGCSSLTSVTIPNSVTRIGNYAFRACSNLTSITIPNSVTSIGDDAFSYCSSLTSITIPNSVTSIGDDAFYKCSSLTTVKVDIETPLDINDYAFSNRANATLIVPNGCKSAYKAASYWRDFKKIVEFPNPNVNQDNKVNVVDVVDIARFVIGSPAQTFVELIADINSDGAVNLGDAVCLVNEIAGDQNFVKGWVAPSGLDANDALNLTGRNGCLSLNLENEQYYTAFQFDLYVPESADVTLMMLNMERKHQHQLLYNKVKEGLYRVAALSTSNNEFNGNNGELLNIALAGADNSEVSVQGIKFFDAKGQEYLFDDIEGAVATGLNSLTPTLSKGEGEIYNVSGQRLNKMQQGVNIVEGKKVLY